MDCIRIYTTHSRWHPGGHVTTAFINWFGTPSASLRSSDTPFPFSLLWRLFIMALALVKWYPSLYSRWLLVESWREREFTRNGVCIGYGCTMRNTPELLRYTELGQQHRKVTVQWETMKKTEFIWNLWWASSALNCSWSRYANRHVAIPLHRQYS